MELPKGIKMSNRPQKTNPATIVAEERKQQAFWRNVVSYIVATNGPMFLADVPDISGGVLDIQYKNGGLDLSIVGYRRTLLRRIKSAWQVLVA
jgi:hypothetical protein